MNRNDAPFTSPHGARPARPSLTRATAVIAATGLAGALIAVFAVTSIQASTTDVGTIDGTAVTREEMLFHMERARPAVENEVAVASGVTAIDWDAPVDGRTPLDRLRDVALDELANDRVILELGYENGLIPFHDFAGFTAALDATNSSRAEQLEDGEVVYGLTSFRAQEFYGRTLSELRTKLAAASNDVGAPLFPIADADVVAYFDAHADDWTVNASSYSLTRIAVPVASTTAAELGMQLAELGVDATLAGYPDATISSSTLVGASGVLDDGSRTPDPRMVAEVATLPVGAFASPVVEQGQHVVYRLDAISVDRDTALATYSSRIRALLEADALDTEIATRIAAQDRQIDSNALHQLTMEDTH